MTNTVLITGLCGMIGSHVAERVLRDFSVVGMDDLSGGNVENVPQGALFQWASIANASAVQRIFEKYQPRFVIHCAAMAAENLSHNCRVHTYQNNLVGEAIIRNAAIKYGVECMVSMSSIAVMGHQEPPFTEETTPAPCDPYGVSKWAGEMDARCAKEFFDLNYVVFRPHNVIGRAQSLSDRYRNVASIFIRAIKEGKPLPIFGDGEQTRAFSPVSYVADVIAASIQRPATWNQIYNVGSDDPMSVNQLAAMLEKLMKKPLPRIYMEQRKEAVHAHMTHDKVRAIFPDIRPQEDIESVLSNMLEEALTSDLPPMQKGPDIEIAKNLPASWK